MIAAAITLGAVWPVRFEANIRRSHRRGLIPARFRETKRRAVGRLRWSGCFCVRKVQISLMRTPKVVNALSCDVWK
jgi:hypothetical protein